MINDNQTNTLRYFPPNVSFEKPTPKTQLNLPENESFWTPVQPIVF